MSENATNLVQDTAEESVNALTKMFGNSNDESTLGDNDTAGSEVSSPNQRTNINKALPGPDSPLIFKIVPQRRPSGKVEGYWAITAHTHLVGDGDPTNKKNYRSHLCQKTVGAKNCPECDKYYAIKETMYAMEKQGQKGSAAYLKADAQSKLIAPSQKGWLMVVLPGNPEVKAIRMPKDVLNKLWGKPATKFKPEVESLIKKMVAAGEDPYALKSSQGWIAAYKVGEGMGTQYAVAPATMTVAIDKRDASGNVVIGPNGSPVKSNATFPLDATVHEAIHKTKTSDLPQLVKFEERNVWTLAESTYYATNLRTPASQMNQKGGHEEDADPLDANGAPSSAGAPAASTGNDTQRMQDALNSAVDLSAINNML